MKLRFVIALATAFGLLATAAPARADITLTPFIGTLFSGDLPTNKAAYGVSLAAMGAGVFGGEFDFSWSPNFVDASPFSAAVTEANLTANLIVGIPIGGTHGASVRPYVVGGGGLLRATAKQSDFLDKVTSNDFAWDFGGGVMGAFNEHFGLRGDIRYFRTNTGSNEYKFWRGSAGLAIKF